MARTICTTHMRIDPTLLCFKTQTLTRGVHVGILGGKSAQMKMSWNKAYFLQFSVGNRLCFLFVPTLFGKSMSIGHPQHMSKTPRIVSDLRTLRHMSLQNEPSKCPPFLCLFLKVIKMSLFVSKN
jgi:hypothetical protein